MGCTGALCAFMDGNCGYTDRYIYRNMDLQMGYQPNACAEGITFMGQ